MIESKKTVRTCRHCNAEFFCKHADVMRGWAKFCSKACASAARVGKPRGDLRQRLDRAERALIGAGWTYTEGAAEWKPPVGPSASPLLERIDKLQALSVENIMLGIVPGDGSGYEVYAKSVTDVEQLLSKTFEELDTVELQRDQLQARMDWIEKVNTLHRSFETLYVVDGYQVTITWDGEPISPDYHGETLEQAIDKAMSEFDMDAKPRWLDRKESPLTVLEQRDQLLAALEKAVAQLVDSPNGEIIGSYDGDADLIAEMQTAIAAVNGKKPTDDRSAIEEFVAVWFEATEEWVAILPNGHVLSGKWGAVGYAVNAALQYLGRGEAEFQLPDGGDGTFYRYVKDEEHWQEGGTPC